MINRLKITRIVTSLATSIGTSALLAIPGWASTLSSSESIFKINNFSALPLDVTTLHDTNTQAIAPNGLVKSNASANALFLTNESNQSSSQANGSSVSVVSGSGHNYSGLAQSVAQIIGYTFQIKSGETFSFDFDSSLNLNTSIDQPEIEAATAIGTVSLGLYESADPTNLTLLDFLTLSSNLGTPGSRTLTVDQSTGITFSSKQSSLNSLLESNQASASASVQGRLSRSFTSPTSLVLIEYGFNQASVVVPEPSTVLASLVCLGLVGVRSWHKLKSDPNRKRIKASG